LLFFFQAEDGIRDRNVTGVQTCALPILTGVALPSPPSHGVGTRVGSGHEMSGKLVGPNRPSSPFALDRSALSTFSGVIGTSSTRSEERRVGKECRSEGQRGRDEGGCSRE